MPRFVLVSLLLACACGDSKKAPAPTPEPAPVALDAATPVLPKADRLPLPADVQPGFKASAVTFLGWSRDSTKFAIRVTHLAPRWSYNDAGVASFELIQIHDALSGAMLLGFQQSKTGRPTSSGHATALWRSAQPKNEWGLWKRANPLAPPSASVNSDGWSLHGKTVARTVGASDAFTIKRRKDHFAVRWVIRAGEQERRKRPVVRLNAKRGAETRKSLKFTMPFRPSEFAGEIADEVTALGTLRAHFSPSGSRVVWITSLRLQVDNDAFPPPDARFFLRSVGPQVKIIDAGAGLEQARGVALLLEKNGIAVTVVETAKEPSGTTEIYFREPGRDAAQAAARLLPGVPTEKLEKDGWLDLIVFLGAR